MAGARGRSHLDDLLPQQAGSLNIWATYTVRQASQLSQDVRIIAHIGGTLLDPKLDLSSDTRFALSYTEILSYLVFGQPSLLGSGDRSSNALRPVAQAHDGRDVDAGEQLLGFVAVQHKDAGR